MEKDFYITETAYYPSDTNQTTPNRQKINTMPQPSRVVCNQPNRKFTEQIPPQSFYDGKKVKPGIIFYKTILEIEELRANGQYNGPTLQLNIPETVLLTDNSNSMIYTQDGIVKVEPFVSNEAFLAKLQNPKMQNTIFPLITHSSITGITFSNSIIMSNEVTGIKIIPRSQGFICRRFVRPYSDTPNLLKLYFTPISQGSIKKNHGFKFISHNTMDENLFKKKHRQTHNYLINTENHQSFSFTLIKGKALKICQQMAQSLTTYLEKGLGIRINQLVLDFVIDNQKIPWLLDVKSIKSKILTKLWDIGNCEQIQLITEKNTNSQLCRLCGMMYSKPEMIKLVTSKLIWELIQHIKARGIPFNNIPHLKKEGYSYVCDVCYELIVAEHQLIDVQKQFSGLLNVASSQIQRVMLPPKIGGKPFYLTQQDFTTGEAQGLKLKSWRLFFYLQKIKNYERVNNKTPSIINLDISFKSFKETFTKIIPQDHNEQPKISKSRLSMASRVHSAKLMKKSIVLQKFAQSIISRQSLNRNDQRSAGRPNLKQKDIETATTMISKISTSQIHSKQVISIQKVKVFVLYTKKHHSGNIFANTQMEFHMTIDDQTFDGRSFTLQQLKNKDTCQRHSSQIFLFNKALKYCNLELTVGLICDGEVQLDYLGLEESDGIFYHKKASTICSPLPDEWMQVFTRGQEVPSHSKELSYDEIRSSYLNRQQSILRQSFERLNIR